MYVSRDNIQDLIRRSNNNINGIERIIIHDENSKKLQLMCIAFKPGKIYKPIADDCDGWITFLVIRNTLTIKTYDFKNKKLTLERKLKENEFLKIPRKLFRETIGDKNNSSVYVEIIEGDFNPSKRIFF